MTYAYFPKTLWEHQFNNEIFQYLQLSQLFLSFSCFAKFLLRQKFPPEVLSSLFPPIKSLFYFSSHLLVYIHVGNYTMRLRQKVVTRCLTDFTYIRFSSKVFIHNDDNLWVLFLYLSLNSTLQYDNMNKKAWSIGINNF